MTKFLALFAILSPLAFGQFSQGVLTVFVDPTIAPQTCNSNSPVEQYNGSLYTCQAGVYALAGGGVPSSIPSANVTFTQENGVASPGLTVPISQMKYDTARKSLEDFGCSVLNADNSPCWANMVTWANANYGSQIDIPIHGSGAAYTFLSPAFLPSYTKIVCMGSSSWCNLNYAPTSNPGTVVAAFNGISTQYSEFDNIQFSAAAAFPPNVVVVTGRAPSGGFQGGNITWLNDRFSGYNVKAVFNSIASETSRWWNCRWINNGSAVGPSYSFYTSGSDDLSVCGGTCATNQSNLSLVIDGQSIFSVSGSPANAIYGIGDQLTGGMGSHFYENGYMYGRNNSADEAVRLIAGAEGSGSNDVIDIRNWRFELMGYGVHFVTATNNQIAYVNVEQCTLAATVAQKLVLADTGVNVAFSNIVNNTGSSTAAASMTFDILQFSWLKLPLVQNGVITVTTTANKNVIDFRPSNSASLVLPNGQWHNNTLLHQLKYSGLDQGLGANLACGATLAPTNLTHKVTGSSCAATTSITVPVTTGLTSGTPINLINETGAVLQFNTGGNIFSAFTLGIGEATQMTYDGTNWYPPNVSAAPTVSANSLFGNNTGSPAAGASLSVAQINTLLGGTPASPTTYGVAECDNTTISCASGIMTVIGGAGGVALNQVTSPQTSTVAAFVGPSNLGSTTQYSFLDVPGDTSTTTGAVFEVGSNTTSTISDLFHVKARNIIGLEVTGNGVAASGVEYLKIPSASSNAGLIAPSNMQIGTSTNSTVCLGAEATAPTGAFGNALCANTNTGNVNYLIASGSTGTGDVNVAFNGTATNGSIDLTPKGTGTVKVSTSISAVNFTSTSAAPTVAISGAGCSAGAVVTNNAAGIWSGTVAAGGTGAACITVITLPAATTGWACRQLIDFTTPTTGNQTATTTTSATFAAMAMTSADAVQFMCAPY